MRRLNGRGAAQIRPVEIVRQFTKYAEGSVLITCGDTKVLCNASVEQRVPKFMKGEGRGWVTAEYSLLPRSTHTRTDREVNRGKASGRTLEIQRLIGRALRAVVDLEALGERTITIDCDVLQADGGTRTAAITGAFVALVDAVHSFASPSKPFPVKDFLAAISVGIWEHAAICDLDYEEDSHAMVDMNVVRTGSGALVEVQGTGEESTFSRKELDVLLDLAEEGTNKLMEVQREALGAIANLVGK